MIRFLPLQINGFVIKRFFVTVYNFVTKTKALQKNRSVTK